MDETKMIELMGTMVSVAEELINAMKDKQIDGLMTITVDKSGYISAVVNNYDLTRYDADSSFRCLNITRYQE